ncbi:MAG: ComEC/Rec2 family competence protein, partial [Gammaproteobacteria bacterium]
MGRLWRWLAATIAAEQDRFFNWVPVLFGSGIAIYFAQAREPTLLVASLIAAAAVAVSLLWRRVFAGLLIGSALVWLSLGVLAAKVASEIVAAPVLGRDLRSVAVTGWIELVEPLATGGERITVRAISVGDLAPDQIPRRVRVRIPKSATPFAPGDAVTVRANLLPPAGPALPGAYDFARAAWFLGIGAVGAAREAPEAADVSQPMLPLLRAWLPFERLRQRISRRVTAALPGETGAIAAALLTGERGGITETTNQAYRDSGIFHILSISGLHMTVFAGAVYVASRFLLSLVPLLALGFSIKKWAAVAGLAGTFGYLLISGGSPPAVRSAIMIAVMFLAVLLDRPALALRNIALAALIILLASPSSLIDVGFQMSFAAVVALVSGVEAWRDWRVARAGDVGPRTRSLPGSAGAFVGAITLTTLIATAAVAPFAAYYFHKSTQYGVLANLAAVPFCNLIVMPAALATLLAMPFGLEAWPLVVMGYGIDAMTWVAIRVAAIPGAVALVPAISARAFALMVVGGLWLCLWGGRWRQVGLLPIAAGLALAPLHSS